MEMEEDFSRAALLSFLDFLENRGLANTNTAQGVRVAVTKILADLSSEEESDVRKIDVSLAIRRFNNKNPNLLSPSSLAEYQRRVILAIREFVSYRANPTGYTGIARGAGTKSDGADRTALKRKRSAEQSDSATEAPAPTTASGSTGLSLSFPLRSDFLAQIVVPRDLKTDEARRLTAFISTLAVDYAP